jgi:hypothetical protein
MKALFGILCLGILAPAAHAASVVPLPSDRVAFCFDADNNPTSCEKRMAWWVLQDDVYRAAAAAQNAGPPPKEAEQPKPKEPKEPYVGDWSLSGNMGYGQENHGNDDTTPGWTFGGKLGYKFWVFDTNFLLQYDAGSGKNGGGIDVRFGRLIPVYQSFGVKLVASGGRARRVYWKDDSTNFAGAGMELVFAGQEHGLTIGGRYQRYASVPGTAVTDWMGSEHPAGSSRRGGASFYVEWNRIIISEHFLWRRANRSPMPKKETPR